MKNTPVGRKEINGHLRRLAETAGGSAWIVGGLLRDALLGRPLADVDLAVNGDARGLAQAFGKPLGRAPFALDEERGTYRVVAGTGPHAPVFDFCRWQGRDLLTDLARRDLTINAMALPIAAWGRAGWKKALVDPHRGWADLKARRLRFVSPQAVVDDPLRLLRLFRFGAELDFRVDPKSLSVVRRHHRLLTASAPERVREELMKLLSTPRAAVTLGAMDRAGLLAVLFPEVDPMRKTGRDYYGPGGVLAHSLAAVASLERLLGELPHQFPRFHRPLWAHLNEPFAGFPRWAHLKLVELFHDVGKPATAKREKGQWHFYGHDAVGAKLVTDVARRLRLSSEESRSLARQVGGHMRPGNLAHQPVLTDRAVYRYYRDLEGSAVDLLLVSLADHYTYLSFRARRARRDPVFQTVRKMLEGFFNRRETVDPPRLLGGHELMKALRLSPGPEVGRLLSLIREAQAAGEVSTVKDALRLARSQRDASTVL